MAIQSGYSEQIFGRKANFPYGHAAVQVVASTWARDSHDLFDFEAHHLHTKTFTVLKSMLCVRTGSDTDMVSDEPNVPNGPNSDALLRLVQRDGLFWVDKALSACSSRKLWLVVRDIAGAGHTLSEGDIMKLGRFKFRVRQLVAVPGAEPELRLDDLGPGAVCCPDALQNEQLKQTLCRICLLEGSTEEDPLITPCLCRGSIEFVHLGCLRHWIRGRLNAAESGGGSYFYRPLPCELCKATYPTYVSRGDEKTPLLEVPKTTPPFIVLENMVRDSALHQTRGLHVISLAEKVLKLGRGHESDVRITDVSISRCHAMIRFHRGQFVLQDNNSKFGTLVAMKRPKLLEPDTTVSIQIGPTVLSMTVQADLGGTGCPALLQLEGARAEAEDSGRRVRLSLLTGQQNAEARAAFAGDAEDAPEASEASEGSNDRLPLPELGGNGDGSHSPRTPE